MIVSLLNRILNKVEQHRKKILFPKGRNIKIHGDLMLGNFCTALIPSNKASINISQGVNFRHYCHVSVYESGELIIGENVFFNNSCSINCLGKTVIGNNTIFGENVKIYDHNHKHSYANGKLFVERKEFTVGNVEIGANCWIGSNVTILKNVTIGDNVIIGANNLIYKPVPSNVIIKARTEHNTQHP